MTHMGSEQWEGTMTTHTGHRPQRATSRGIEHPYLTHRADGTRRCKSSALTDSGMSAFSNHILMLLMQMYNSSEAPPLNIKCTKYWIVSHNYLKKKKNGCESLSNWLVIHNPKVGMERKLHARHRPPSEMQGEAQRRTDARASRTRGLSYSQGRCLENTSPFPTTGFIFKH